MQALTIFIVASGGLVTAMLAMAHYEAALAVALQAAVVVVAWRTGDRR